MSSLGSHTSDSDMELPGPPSPVTQLSPIGYMKSPCGYCHGKSANSGGYTYSVISKFLTAQFYEKLVCRGWRRSGTLIYKPDQRVSCCPHYTIRLDALAFKSAKDQRQSLNRFNRYILGEDYIKETTRLHPRSKAETLQRKQEFNLAQRVHEVEYAFLSLPPEPAHKFQISLEPDTFSDEKFALFENYQRIVHHEPPSKITPSGFKSFLCTSPIPRSTYLLSGRARRTGTYHQCYRLDGQLVALAVLDLLPNAVSAVYFMNHESLHAWVPGKLSALREAALAAEDGYRWYMMGFFIPSCAKMRYKGDFHPHEVLDPETYVWDPLDEEMKRRMDARRYVSLSREKREGISAPEVGAEPLVAGEEEKSDGSEGSWGELEPLPLHARGMPGVMSREELETFDLGSVKVKIQNNMARLENLTIWDEEESVDDVGSFKSLVGDLVAALGEDLAKEMCLTF